MAPGHRFWTKVTGSDRILDKSVYNIPTPKSNNFITFSEHQNFAFLSESPKILAPSARHVIPDTAVLNRSPMFVDTVL